MPVICRGNFANVFRVFTLPFKSAAGFNSRLRAAMAASGLTTDQDLAAVIGTSIPTARILLRSSTPVVDAVTLFRICDRTGFSGRWLVNGLGPTRMRLVSDLDEQRLLDIIRALPDAARDAFFDRLLDLVHTTS